MECTLTEKMTRTERQEFGVKLWIKNRLCGTLDWATGVGKTNGAMIAIRKFQKAYPDRLIIVGVPNDPLVVQWIENLKRNNLYNSSVIVRTTNSLKSSPNPINCALLVIDEVHKIAAPTFLQIFEKINYKAILGLTATFERVDGKHEIIASKAPIIDTITLDEAIENNWLSPYREYKVLVSVDLTEYNTNNKKFYEYFEFFNRDFTFANNCLDWKFRANYLKTNYSHLTDDERKELNRQLTINAANFNRTLQARKKFISDHPKKIELTNLILEHRTGSKCITFSSTKRIADKIKYGEVYSSKDSKKSGNKKLTDFLNSTTGVLNTMDKLNEGFDDPSINLGIILGYNSSKTKKTQRVGRIIRLQEGKISELFTLVLKGTVEEEWFRRSNENENYITITESQLLAVLNNEEYTPKKNTTAKLQFRF